MLLDTGSSITWVPSPSCPRAKCPGSHFEHSLSETFIDHNIPLEIKYGVGKLKGNLVSDQIYSRQINPM